MKVALDTNVLAYAEGTNGTGMRDKALDLIQRLPPESVVLPVQALGELFNVLVRKAKWRPNRARAAVLNWRDAFAVTDTSAAVMVNAADLASSHGLTIWDSVVLATAAESGCRLILSEDLQDGFTWRGVTVSNPFAPTPHPQIARRTRIRSRCVADYFCVPVGLGSWGHDAFTLLRRARTSSFSPLSMSSRPYLYERTVMN
jgi:predicted nucleic acid-binding protein